MIRPHTEFTFKLTAIQAQTVFNLLACMMEDDSFREIWKSRKSRRLARASVQRFERQLNRQYKLTGVEI